MGRYKVNQTDGSLSLISGHGKAEYGASTVRTGRVNFAITADTNITQSITFNEPMPDADYLVDIFNISQHSFWTISGKTANGFNLHIRSTATDPTYGVTYTAFKLYTDTEYNEVLKVVNEETYATVTGNGVKTVGQLMDELYALIDVSKITRNSKLITPTGYVYRVSYISSDLYEFALSRVTAIAVGVFTIDVKSSGSTARNATIDSNGASFGDTTTTVVSNGSKYTLKY